MTSVALKKEDDVLTTRDRIIDVATGLFLEAGYAGTSMSALAKACGIQKASLYHHFESKESVVFACLQSGYTDHVAEMRRVSENQSLSFKERIPLILDAVYGAIVESKAGKMATVVAETTSRFPEMSERFNSEFVEEMQQIFDLFVRSGIEHGAFAKMDPLTLYHAMFGIPVNLTLCRSMFAHSPVLDDRYDIEAVKAHHLAIMNKLLLQPNGVA